MDDRVRIGTSGWEYRHWRGGFYPRELSRDRWLEYYAARFDTVELNASFYRLPETSTFERWAGRVPSGFRFAVKASRTQRLAAWADRIAGWVGEGRSVWAYFNNDLGGHAATDAARLREYVGRAG